MNVVTGKCQKCDTACLFLNKNGKFCHRHWDEYWKAKKYETANEFARRTTSKKQMSANTRRQAQDGFRKE